MENFEIFVSTGTALIDKTLKSVIMTKVECSSFPFGEITLIVT